MSAVEMIAWIFAAAMLALHIYAWRHRDRPFWCEFVSGVTFGIYRCRGHQ